MSARKGDYFTPQLGIHLKSGRFDGILTELGIKPPFVSSLNPKEIKKKYDLRSLII